MRDFPLGGRGGGRAGPGAAADGRTAGGREDGLVLVELRLELHVLDLEVPDAGQELLGALRAGGGGRGAHLGGLTAGTAGDLRPGTIRVSLSLTNE